MPRQRKPVEDHIKSGHYRPSRHGPKPGQAVEPVEIVPPPEKPTTLSEAAGRIWDEVILLRPGAVRPSDGQMLVIYCELRAAWAETLDQVRVATGGSRAQLVTSLATLSDRLDKLSSKFGLSPVDRVKLDTLKRAEPAAGPPKPKVPTRPKTALDLAGKPTAEPAAATKKPAKKPAKAKPKK